MQIAVRQASLDGLPILLFSGLEANEGPVELLISRVDIRDKQRNWLHNTGIWQGTRNAIVTSGNIIGDDFAVSLPTAVSRALVVGTRVLFELPELSAACEYTPRSQAAWVRLSGEATSPHGASGRLGRGLEPKAVTASEPTRSESNSIPPTPSAAGNHENNNRSGPRTRNEPDRRAPDRSRFRPGPWVFTTLLLLLLSSAVFAMTVPDLRTSVLENIQRLTALMPRSQTYQPPPCVSFVAVDRSATMEQWQRDHNARSTFGEAVRRFGEYLVLRPTGGGQQQRRLALDRFTESICWSKGVYGPRVIEYFRSGEGARAPDAEEIRAVFQRMI